MPTNNPSMNGASEAAIAQVREARERAENGLEQQRVMIADRVRRLGGVLQSSSDQLSPEDAMAQQLLDQASSRVQRVADYIQDASANDVIEDLHTLARTRPGLFFGGAFLIGLAVGRFAKSSRSERSEPEEREYDDRRVYRSSVVSAQTAPGTDVGARPYQPPPTASSAGSASGLHYGAPPSGEQAKPQPGDASASARAIEPGQGSKS